MAYHPTVGHGGGCSIQNQILEVNVLGCSNLRDTEWFSQQDPYVHLEYGSTKHRTRTDTDGGKNPSFNEKFVVNLVEGLREVTATVWNSNTLSTDDFIGSTRISLEKAISAGYDDSNWPLKSHSGKYAGEIRVIMHFHSPGASAKPGKHGAGYAQVPSPYPAGQYPPQPSYAPPPAYLAAPGGYPPHGGHPPGGHHTGHVQATPSGYPPAGYPPSGFAPAGYMTPPVPGYIQSSVPVQPPNPHGYPGHAVPLAVAGLAAGAAAVGAYGMYSHGQPGHYSQGKSKGKDKKDKKDKSGKGKWK